MPSRKEFVMQFQLNAELGKSYNSTFSKAQSEIVQFQNEIEALNKTQSDIAAFQKQQGAVDATKQKLEALQQQYNNIQREIQETDKFSSSLENRLLSKQQQIKKTSVSLEQQTKKLQQMNTTLKEAGVNTSNLSHESSRLGAQIEDLKERQEKAASSADNFGEQSVSAFDAINQAIAAAGIAASLKEIYDYFIDCSRASREYESAITGVAKTTDLTDEELTMMSESIKDLSTEIPATTDEIAAVTEAAGQLGIQKDSLLDFAETMTMLGTATNMTADEAATALAKFANITGMADKDYGRLGSTIVDLGNNFATTEADITDMATHLASAGTLAGLTEPEILALSTAMSSVGIEAEAGGTSMTQTLNAIEKAVANGGEDLEKFARIAGKSSEEFATTWKNDAITALTDFILGLGRLDAQGESTVLVLEDLGLTGIRQGNMLKSLSLAADQMTGAVNTANTAWQQNTALTIEANKRYATRQSQLTMMYNAYNNLKVAIGDAYAPALGKAYSAGTKVLNGITDFVELHPGLVNAVTTFVGVIGAATAGLGAYAAATKVVIPLMKTLTAIHGVSTFMGVATAIGAVAAAVVGITTAADDGIPSVNELTESAQQMEETLDEANTVYSDTVESTMAAASVADDYITKLEQMGDYASLSAEDQREYHNILALLCQTVPELSDQIDLENNVIRGGTDALRANTEEWKRNALQQAYQEKLTAIYAANADVMIEAEKNSIGLTKANTDLQAANEKLYDSNVRLDELQKESVDKAQEYYEKTGKYKDATEFLTQEYYDLCDSIWYTEQEIESAEKTADAYEEAMEADAEAVAAAKAEMELAQEAVQNLTGATESGAFSTEEAAAQYESVAASVENVMAKVNTLTESYNEAYQAAYDSITGQYAIWDEAAEVVATDAGTINSALESQISYWHDYNANLESLRERTGDIAGLGDLIASFADGSADSVNAIAGLASASDEDLAAMVENWKGLQAEQELAAGSIADIKEDFGRIMDELAAELAADIEAMDLGTEAAESAKATIQGYVNAAYDMLPQVQSAYARIASAATAALTPPNVNSAGNIPGYAVGTDSAAPGFAYVGEHGPELVYFGGGEQVMTAAETAAILSPPTPVEAAYTRDRGPVSISVSFPIHGSATPGTVEALREYGDEFAERVMDVLEDAGIETARRSY